jgi:hypothetical protein
MAETHIGELPPGTKRCKVCAEPINVSAKRCIHCQSDQGWASRLGFSATVLSLLVALITVLTAAIPVIKDALTPRNSGLTASFQGADPVGVHVLVSNDGIRPGSVKFGDWRVARSSSMAQDLLGISFFISSPQAASDRTVDPGKSKVFSFVPTPSYTEPFDQLRQIFNDLLDKKCFFKVIFLSFKAERQEKEFEITCASVSDILKLS